MNGKERIEHATRALFYGVFFAEDPDDPNAEFGWRFFKTIGQAVETCEKIIEKDIVIFEFEPKRLGAYRKETVYTRQVDIPEAALAP